MKDATSVAYEVEAKQSQKTHSSTPRRRRSYGMRDLRSLYRHLSVSSGLKLTLKEWIKKAPQHHVDVLLQDIDKLTTTQRVRHLMVNGARA